jgi:hypothetical protein
MDGQEMLACLVCLGEKASLVNLDSLWEEGQVQRVFLVLMVSQDLQVFPGRKEKWV